MRIDIERHVSCCLPCAQTKSTTTTAPILEYPLPAGPFDVVGLDLLQLPRSSQGSGYILVCVDQFSRFVVLAPLRDKSAATVSHALVSSLTMARSLRTRARIHKDSLLLIATPSNSQAISSKELQ